jgi:hypothetical protein
VCRCGQSMDAMDGSVGFRVIARDMDVLDALQEPGPSLRVFRNTEDAYREAELRNVPIFLYLGYERCGQCDRVQAQLFRDPEFVAYCNAHLVVLIGHSTRDWNDLPKTPLTADGVFFAHNNAYLAELHQVFEDFSVRRDPALGPLPEHVSLFQISPSFNLLNPHRHLITYPEDAVLASEQDLWVLKRGMAEGWREKFEEAQARLGLHLTLEEFENNAPLPDTTWEPTPEDAQMWRRALASMRELHAALALHFDDAGAYPDSLFELRQHFAGLRLPQDPFRGTYFRYERTPDGYTLTCHGAGDRPGGTEIPEKDIVFTQAGMQE